MINAETEDLLTNHPDIPEGHWFKMQSRTKLFNLAFELQVIREDKFQEKSLTRVQLQALIFADLLDQYPKTGGMNFQYYRPAYFGA